MAVDQKQKLKDELKVWLYYQISVVSNNVLTLEDVNSVLVDILHENNTKDPKQLIKA